MSVERNSKSRIDSVVVFVQVPVFKHFARDMVKGCSFQLNSSLYIYKRNLSKYHSVHCSCCDLRHSCCHFFSFYHSLINFFDTTTINQLKYHD